MDEYSGQMEQLNTLLNKRLDAKDVDINIASLSDQNRLSIENLDPEFGNEFHKVLSDDDVLHADQEQLKEESTHTLEILDSYIDMEIGLPRGLDGELYHAKVKSHAVDRDSKLVGIEISNPITDTRLYNVEYPDGTIKNFSHQCDN